MDETIKKYQDKIKYYGDTLYDEYLKHITILHESKDDNALLNILKSGFIKLGKNLKVSQRKYSGGRPKKYIFGNISFDDINKQLLTERVVLYSFHINSSIINDYTLHFNGLWAGGPADFMPELYVKIDKNNKKYKKAVSIMEIRKHIEHPRKFTKNWTKNAQHEVLFEEKISVDKYVDTIILNKNDTDYNKKVSKIIKKKGYTIKIKLIIPSND